MKSLIKYLARMLGLDIRRYREKRDGLQLLFSHYNIDCILDVGANIGQYAAYLRSGGYKGQIVSFEPLSGAYQTLVEVNKKDPLWSLAPQSAIGDYDGDVSINISANSVSSSVLNILEQHVNSEPSSAFITREKVRISKLDSIAPPYMRGHKSIFLKIDVQGFESQVLAGAAGILPQIAGLQVELSLVPLYEGQMLFVDMIEQIRQLGFTLYGLAPGFSDTKTGRLLQADGIFFRE